MRRKLEPEEYRFEVRFGVAIMDAGGLATIPQVFLAHYADLGLDEAMAMLLIQIMKHKWTEDNPYPARDRLPMANNADTRREHTRVLRNRGLLFTRRRYYTVEDAPAPELVGQQTSMVYDLETLLHNCLRMRQWVKAGRPPAEFQVEIPFGIAYQAATGYLHDVPEEILVQCEQCLGVSEDAVQILCMFRRLQEEQLSDGVAVARLVERSGLRPARAQVAIEHLGEAHLIVEVGTEPGVLRLLHDEEFAGRLALLLPRREVLTRARRRRQRKAAVQSSAGTTRRQAPGNDTRRQAPGNDTRRQAPGNDTRRQAPGNDTRRQATGILYPGSKSPPKEEPELKKEEEKEEEVRSSSSSLLYSILRTNNVQEPTLSQLIRLGLEPATAQAWFWWAALSDMEPSRRAGYVILRLQRGDPPPDDLLDLAQAWLPLADDARAVVWRAAHNQHTLWRALPPDLPLTAEQMETYLRLFRAELMPRPAAADAPETAEETEEETGEETPPEPGMAMTVPPAQSPARSTWQAALSQIQLQVTPGDYDTWIRDTTVVSQADRQWVIGAPHGFAREWLENRLRDLVKKTLAGLVGRPVEVEFVVTSAAEQPAQAMGNAGAA